MSIMNYNGGSVLAMTGDKCVCLVTDLRLGERFTTLSTMQPKVHKVANKVYVGLAGFQTDAKTILDTIEFQRSQYELRENRPIKPNVVSTMLSNLLYKHRFGPYFIEPLVAGLDPTTNEPYIAAMDTIGCLSTPEDFVVCGTAADFMMGMCAQFWRKGMKPDELSHAATQAFLAGLGRDAATGWGAVVYTLDTEKVNIKTIRARID